MKFGKEFASQMVPEWQEAYMNYRSLKSILKAILRSRHKIPSTPAMEVEASQAALNRKVSLYRAFSGLTNRHTGRQGSPRKIDEEAILVNAERPEGSEEGRYQTTFLMSPDEDAEQQRTFFRELDHELNKVVKFYKDKVLEVMEEAEDLNKQMDAFIALRIKVEKPVVKLAQAEMTDGASTGVQTSQPIGELDVIDEVEMDEGEWEETQRDNAAETNQRKEGNVLGPNPDSLEILNHVKINIRADTPLLAIKGILMRSRSFSRSELRKVEELMKQAFVEFYHQLRLLKSFGFLNQLAFSKILKKYDKVALRNASKVYLGMVDNSYLGTSDEITRLMERVEATFIKHFANGNRQKGMNTLRPQATRERHRISFLSGFLSGSTVALAVALVVLIHARDILKSEGRGQYMDNIFPLYSLFGFVVLHMLMFSANIYFWRHYRVNYPFIFGFKQGTHLGDRDVFLVSSALAVLSLAAVLSNLDMEMDPRTQSFSTLTELVPLGLMTVVLLILFCPLNIMYRSSRFYFIRCVFHCICAPLYKVTLPDFFLADQLTSQVQAFRSLEFYICYYGWGDFKRRSNKCTESHVFEAFYFIVPIIPYWSRCVQCLRRLFEERDSMHGLNAMKYFATIVALAMRTSYDLKHGTTLKILAATTSTIATIFSTYWDLVMDWGLLRPNPKNPWLREKLLVSNKSIYFAAMVLNVLLRLAWMQSVLGIRETPFLHKKALSAIVACLEIIRRGIWNFFRLENEHLNNVGKYRAFKKVPLPFNYDHDEGKES